jgi:hypothetical protein
MDIEDRDLLFAIRLRGARTVFSANLLDHLESSLLCHFQRTFLATDGVLQIMRMDRLLHAGGIAGEITLDIVSHGCADGSFIAGCFLRLIGVEKLSSNRMVDNPRPVIKLFIFRLFPWLIKRAFTTCAGSDKNENRTNPFCVRTKKLSLGTRIVQCGGWIMNVTSFWAKGDSTKDFDQGFCAALLGLAFF